MSLAGLLQGGSRSRGPNQSPDARQRTVKFMCPEPEPGNEKNKPRKKGGDAFKGLRGPRARSSTV